MGNMHWSTTSRVTSELPLAFVQLWSPRWFPEKYRKVHFYGQGSKVGPSPYGSFSAVFPNLACAVERPWPYVQSGRILFSTPSNSCARSCTALYAVKPNN